jgi:hypothetical protein
VASIASRARSLAETLSPARSKAHSDIKFVEESQVGVAQPDTVRLHGCVNGDAGSRAAAGRCHQPSDQVPPGQQRLATVQDQRDLTHAVRASVVPDPAGGHFGDLV